MLEYLNHLHSLLTDQLVLTNREGEVLSLREGNRHLFQLLRQTRVLQKKVLLVGNGGSAAIVEHMANDLMKMDHIRALTLTSTSLLTALSNDDGYDTAYAQQIARWGEHRDLLIAVSSSGSSDNILNAVRVARRQRMQVLTFSGFDPENPLRQKGDVNLYIPSSEYGMVELAHSVIGHYLTDELAMSTAAVGGSL